MTCLAGPGGLERYSPVNDFCLAYLSSPGEAYRSSPGVAYLSSPEAAYLSSPGAVYLSSPRTATVPGARQLIDFICMRNGRLV